MAPRLVAELGICTLTIITVYLSLEDIPHSTRSTPEMGESGTECKPHVDRSVKLPWKQSPR